MPNKNLNKSPAKYPVIYQYALDQCLMIIRANGDRQMGVDDWLTIAQVDSLRGRGGAMSIVAKGGTWARSFALFPMYRPAMTAFFEKWVMNFRCRRFEVLRDSPHGMMARDTETNWVVECRVRKRASERDMEILQRAGWPHEAFTNYEEVLKKF